MKKNIFHFFLLVIVVSSSFAQNHKVYCKTQQGECDKGLKEEGTITNGKKEGYWKYYYCCVIRQDVMEEGQYENDKRKGIWKYYDVGGYMSKVVTFVDGLENGDFTGYHMGGELKYTGHYADGKLKVRREFYREGQKKIIENFETGEITTYYQNGQIESDGFYEKENWRFKTKELKEYYQNGKLKRIGIFNNDKETGMWKMYHSNGKLKATGEMGNGLRIGKWLQYHDNGQLSGSGEYLANNPLSNSWITYDNKGQKNGINCPEPTEWDYLYLCNTISNRIKPNDATNYLTGYEEKLGLLAAVDAKKDNPEDIKKKMQNFWNAYKTKCKCDAINFIVPNGNILKFLVEQNMFDTQEILIEEYGLDFNFIDPADNINLLDFLITRKARYKSSSLENKYQQLIDLLISIGGKTSK